MASAAPGILRRCAPTATVIAAAACLAALAAGPSQAAVRTPAGGARALAAIHQPAATALAAATPSPRYACYFPITGFYCYAQTTNGNAPLFRSNGDLYTTLPLNDKVKITCYYDGNPPYPWTGDGYEDHVTWENIGNPISGHIPDYYVNLGNNYPWQIGIPKC